MTESTIIVFPVSMREEVRFPEFNSQQIKKEKFLLTDSVETLNRKLWDKIIEERLLLHRLERKKLSERFAKIAIGYRDIFERDLEAFDQMDFNVQIYAVVLTYEGEYFGHIYSWISPTRPEFAFCIGIRSRVDWFFYKNKYPTSTYAQTPISSLLFEGARRFALVKGAKFLIIYQPLLVIKNIAPRLGFTFLSEEEKLSLQLEDYDIGNSIYNYEFLEEPFQDALIRNVEEPIVSQVGNFFLKQGLY